MRAHRLLARTACALALAACAPPSPHPRRLPAVDIAALPVAVAEAAPPPALPAAPEAPPDPRPALRPFTTATADYALPGLERKRMAREHKLETVRALFAEAGVSFPPAELFLRAYKKERELEVWASSRAGEPMVPITRYGICAASGEFGPKRREGDRQVPEGFYTISYLWPNSAYYLSMKIGYPNVSDRILGDPMPGGDIMIHGACDSIGCLAMSDERIEELWVMAETVQESSGIHIHIFPTRDPESLAEHPHHAKHKAFWDDLYEGHALFERHRRPPEVTVTWDGRYRFAARLPRQLQ